MQEVVDEVAIAVAAVMDDILDKHVVVAVVVDEETFDLLDQVESDNQEHTDNFVQKLEGNAPDI